MKWSDRALVSFDQFAMGALAGEQSQQQQQSSETAVSTTVSPTFQQSFTPQISPVIQVSSGSGSQTGTANQRAGGGQTAAGGSGSPASTGGGAMMPAQGGYAPPTGDLYENYDGFSDSGSDYPYTPAPIYQNQGGGISWPIVAGVGAVGILGAYLLNKNKSKKAKAGA